MRGGLASTVFAPLTAALAGAVGWAVSAGVARGMFTLLQATAVTDRWGTRHYGRVLGEDIDMCQH